MSSDASYGGEDSRIASQRFDPSRFESFLYEESEWMMEADFDDSSPYGGGDVVAPPSNKTEVVTESEESAGNADTRPPSAAEGIARREWRSQNAIRLMEKDKREKEKLKEIIEEADEFKGEYYKKWKIRCENSRFANREKEKLFVESSSKFHAEADKHYWKAISELIPKEIANIEKKGKKEKVSIVVNQGPKPGKPTDLSRMRQIHVKLKHKPPRNQDSKPSN